MKNKNLQRAISLLLCVVMCFGYATPIGALELEEAPAAEIIEDEEFFTQEEPEEEKPAEIPEEPAEVLPVQEEELPAGAAGEVAINETNFPDAMFRELIKYFDTDEDGMLSQAEIAEVTDIDCSNEYEDSEYKITSLKGIEYFTNLQGIFAYNNDIAAIDVSKNTALTDLDLRNNKLTSIDVSKNTELDRLDVGGNKLTSLDVSNNKKLTTLQFDGNSITEIDLSQNTQLEYLKTDENPLAALDVTENKKLIQLDCSTNGLTTLDVTNNTELRALYCNNNELTSLDVSKNIVLEELHFMQNKLTSIDLSKNTELLFLYYSHNNIASIDLSNNLALLEINCEENGIKELDVSNQENLISLYCSGNELTSLDVSNNIYLDALFCSYNKLTSLDVSKNTALWQLICHGNKLTSLDVSQNTELRSLFCGESRLTSLDISKNTKLSHIYCGYANINTLDLSNNPDLKTLECESNNITSLDLSKNFKLEELYCGYNNIASLDLSKNLKLIGIFCQGNKLTELDLSQQQLLGELDCSFNKLAFVNISDKVNFYGELIAEGNKMPIDIGSGSTFDLSNISGFDMAKVSNLTNATVNGNTLTVTNKYKTVTYNYDCGNDNTVAFAMEPVFTLSANEPQLTARVEKTTVGNNECFEVIVGVKNNPGFESIVIETEYDNNIFNEYSWEFVRSEDPEAEWIDFDIDYVYADDDREGKKIISYSGEITEEIEFFSFTFVANENAKAGNYPIKIKFFDDAQSLNGAGEEVYFADANEISIEVKERKPGELSSEDPQWDGYTHTEPLTDANGVYQISHAEELAWFAEAVNSEKIPANSSAVLTADIYMNDGNRYDSIGSSWNDENFAFLGSFDGQGHTVYDLYEYTYIWENGKGNGGLFGKVGSNGAEKTVIKNVAVENTIWKNTVYFEVAYETANVGSVIDYAENAEITNVSYKNSYGTECDFSGEAGFCKGIGGIVGYAYNCVIKNCSNECDIEAVDGVGGIVGYAKDTDIYNCYNTGKIGGRSGVGGIAGAFEGGKIENCYSIGKITGETAYSAIAGSSTGDIKNTYYLNTSCENGTGTAITAAEVNSADFINTLNTNAGETLFKAGYEGPVFTWQEGVRTDAKPGGKLVTKVESTEAANEGQMVEVDLYIENNPGFETLNAVLEYDKSVFLLNYFESFAPVEIDYQTKKIHITYEDFPEHADEENYRILTVSLRVIDAENIEKTSVAFKFDAKEGSVNDKGEYLYWESGEAVEIKLADRKPGEIFSKDSTWDGETLTEPDVDENGAYVLSHGEEYAWFAMYMAEQMIPNTANAVLDNDIDLSGFRVAEIGQEWNPYLGTFDGKGYTIKNVEIGGYWFEEDGGICGLFRVLGSRDYGEKAAVKNLTVKALDMICEIGGNNVEALGMGAVVGYAENAEIINVISKTDVTVQYWESGLSCAAAGVGGIVGRAIESKIEGCFNFGSVTGINQAGGVVGYAEDCVIAKCGNAGAIKGTEEVGGVAGAISGSTIIENSYNNGTVTAKNIVGGFVGAQFLSYIKNSFNTGKVMGESNFGATVGSYTGAKARAVAAPWENLYYLETSCENAFGGTAPAAAEVPEAKTATEMASAEFVETLNANAGEAVFVKGENDSVPGIAGAKIPVLGDVNGDGKITVRDAMLAYDYVNGVWSLNDDELAAADLDGNGEVTADEAALIYSYCNGKVESLG